MTVEIYLSKWLEKYKKDLRPTTYARYHDLIEQHMVPILGNTKLQGVTKTQVVRMYNVLVTESTQHKTKHNFYPNGLLIALYSKSIACMYGCYRRRLTQK